MKLTIDQIPIFDLKNGGVGLSMAVNIMYAVNMIVIANKIVISLTAGREIFRVIKQAKGLANHDNVIDKWYADDPYDMHENDCIPGKKP